MIVDQIVLQQSSKEILKLLEDGRSVPTSLFENWITALIFIQRSNNELDPDTITLRNYLNTQYIYQDNHGEAFDLGSVYGSLLFLNFYFIEKHGDMKYKAFDNVDIPTDFEVQIKDAKTNIQRLRNDDILLEEEFNIIMSILDGSEARALSRVRKLTNGDTY